MRTYFFILINAISALSLHAQTKEKVDFVIMGEVAEAFEGAKVFLFNLDSGNNDSLGEAVIVNQTFIISGSFTDYTGTKPELIASISFKVPNNQFFHMLMLEQDTIYLKLEDEFSISYQGSPLQKDFQSTYDILLNEIDSAKHYSDLIDNETDQSKKEKLSARLKAYELNFAKAMKNDFLTQPPSKFRYFLIYGLVPKFMELKDYDFLEKVCKQAGDFLNEKFKSAICSAATPMKLGMKAPSFELPDDSDSLLSLTDFKGNYLFIDFWASWCAPCIKQFPELKTIYHKFADRGINFLSISIDKKSHRWRKAIIEQELTEWSQLIDREQKVSDAYNVYEIPRNFLLGPDLNIIAMDLNTDELEEKLDEFLDSNKDGKGAANMEEEEEDVTICSGEFMRLKLICRGKKGFFGSGGGCSYGYGFSYAECKSSDNTLKIFQSKEQKEKLDKYADFLAKTFKEDKVIVDLVEIIEGIQRELAGKNLEASFKVEDFEACFEYVEDYINLMLKKLTKEHKEAINAYRVSQGEKKWF